MDIGSHPASLRAFYCNMEAAPLKDKGILRKHLEKLESSYIAGGNVKRCSQLNVHGSIIHYSPKGSNPNVCQLKNG